MADTSITVSQSNTSSNSGLTKSGYLVIIAGQSNGNDRFIITGNLPAQYQGVQSDCYTYYKTVDDSSDNGSWVQMNAGVNTKTGTAATGFFGIGINITNRLLTTYSKYGYVVPTAVSGSYIAGDQTPSWDITKSAEYYERCISYHYRKAISKIGGVSYTPVFIWVHGESDSDTLAHGTAYEANLTALINKFRIDSGFPNMKIIITRLRSDYGGASLGLTQVRAAQVNIAATLPNVYIYDTETIATPLSTDGQHYNPITSNYGGTQSALNLANGLADLISTF